MRKDIFPSVKEALPVVVLTALFLLLTAVCIGLRTEHLLMTGLFLILFFAGKTTRKLAVALLPFIIFGISYDWMRVYPNYEVNPIDVQGLYEAEKSLFGISIDGTRLIPCEYFARNHCTVGDFFAGIFYLCWVPVPIAFGLYRHFTYTCHNSIQCSGNAHAAFLQENKDRPCRCVRPYDNHAERSGGSCGILWN